MTTQGKFLVYCIEIYKYAKGATGKQVLELFERYGVMDYILQCYGALHTTGEEYIINDIDCFVATRKNEAADVAWGMA